MSAAEEAAAIAIALMFEQAAALVKLPVETYGCTDRMLNVSVDDECDDGGIEIRSWRFDDDEIQIVIAALRLYAALASHAITARPAPIDIQFILSCADPRN